MSSLSRSILTRYILKVSVSMSSPGVKYPSKDKGFHNWSRPPNVTEVSLGKNNQRRMKLFRLPRTSTVDDVSVIFVPGFMSCSSHGDKADHLWNHCHRKGIEYVCYDPEGLGQSAQGCDVEKLEFEHWIEDCAAAMEAVQGRKVVVVGSSMGAHVAIKNAAQEAFEDRIKAMLLIAPAINTLYGKYETWRRELFDEETRDKLDRGETHLFPTEYGIMPVRKGFFDGCKENELSLPLNVEIPVKIFHGIKDDVVPYEKSLKLVQDLKGSQIDLVLRKDGSHRLSTKEDLAFLSLLLDDLIKTIQ